MEEQKNAYQKISDDIFKLLSKIQKIKFYGEFEEIDIFKEKVEKLRENFINKSIKYDNQILNGDFNDIVSEITQIDNEIENYLKSEEFTKIKNEKVLERFNRRIDSIISYVNNEDSKELFDVTEKISQEINKYCETNPEFELYNFNLIISKAILRILIRQAKSGEEIDIERAKQICKEDDLLLEIKNKILDMAEDKNNPNRQELLDIAYELNEDSLYEEKIWEQIANVKEVKILGKNTELEEIYRKSSQSKRNKILENFGFTVYTIEERDEETNEIKKTKEDYSKIFPKKFGKKASKIATIEVHGEHPKICKGAFSLYPDVKTIILGDKVKEIEKGAFAGIMPEFVILGNGIEEICDNCFAGSKTEKIMISDSVKKIGKSSFENCNFLKEICIGKGVTELGEKSFYNCKKLEIINIPNNVKIIYNNSFGSCDKLKKVILHNGLEIIGDCAFSNCQSLSEIEIPDSVNKIGQSAFQNCVNLRNIKLPENLNEISVHAFNYCKKLKSINLTNKIKTIGINAFYNSGLEEIEIPNSVEKIEGGAFAQCVNLESVKIGKGAKKIGKYCFINSGIKKIQIPDNVEIIEEGVFAQCVNLEEVKIGENVKFIGDNCFQGTNINEIEFPDSIEKIGCLALADCKSLKRVKLGKGIKELPEYCFKNTNLENFEIEITSDGDYIDSETFLQLENIDTLKDITIINNGKTVKIDKNAFINIIGDCRNSIGNILNKKNGRGYNE